jgi:hypothetical protein
MSRSTEARRRRSSSLLYQEPPESLEQVSDQSALPNLNAEWVNAKGIYERSLLYSPSIDILSTDIQGKANKHLDRGMDRSLCHNHSIEDHLRHHPGCITRAFVDVN